MFSTFERNALAVPTSLPFSILDTSSADAVPFVQKTAILLLFRVSFITCSLLRDL